MHCTLEILSSLNTKSSIVLAILPNLTRGEFFPLSILYMVIFNSVLCLIDIHSVYYFKN